MTGSNLHKIQWYFSASNNVNIYGEDVLEITDDSKYNLDMRSNEKELIVILTVNDLNEENDTGTYWCRGFLLDGTALLSPNSFQLRTSKNWYKGPCNANVTLKNSISVCAELINSTQTTSVSSSMSSPLPLPTNIFSLPPESGITNDIMGFTTTDDRLHTTFPPELDQLPVLYIIIGIVGFLVLICAVLAFVICLLCKKVRNKGNYTVQ